MVARVCRAMRAQSNMQFSLNTAFNASTYIASAAGFAKSLRLLTVSRKLAQAPAVDAALEQPWAISSVRKTHLLGHFVLRTINLPRQARDKHRENSNRDAFFAGRSGKQQQILRSVQRGVLPHRPETTAGETSPTFLQPCQAWVGLGWSWAGLEAALISTALNLF
jgi:hypothetical protein